MKKELSNELVSLLKDGKRGTLKAVKFLEKEAPSVCKEKLREQSFLSLAYFLSLSFVGLLIIVGGLMSPLWKLHLDGDSYSYMGGWLLLLALIEITGGIMLWAGIYHFIEFLRIKIAPKIVILEFLKTTIR